MPFPDRKQEATVALALCIEKLGKALYWINLNTDGAGHEDNYDNCIYFVEQAIAKARRR
jgi:hypothetical protein